MTTESSRAGKTGAGVIKVDFFNAQSLRNKMDELSEYCHKHKPDIIGTSETWLDASHKEGEVALNNYEVHIKNRSDEPNRGGVAFYIRNDLKYELIDVEKHTGPCK